MNARRKLFFLSGKGGAPAVWTPAELFASGESGIWLESKQAYLFQDDAGTTPVTAVDQTVGRAEGQSPNANNAIQSVAAKKPLYKNDAGIESLFFDPVDDILDLPLVTGDFDNFVFAIAVKPQTANYPNPRYFSMATTGLNLQCGYINDGTIFMRVDGTTYNTATKITLDNIYIIQHIRQSGVSEIRINGANELFTTGTVPSANTEQVDKGYIGGGYSNTAGINNEFKMTGNIYAGIFRYGSINATQRNNLDTYLANLAGITL